MEKNSDNKILESELMIPMKPGDVPPQGAIIRRIGEGKDQQGMFTRMDEEAGYILVSIVDPSAGEYLAEAGILKPQKKDKLFVYKTSFADSSDSSDALQILLDWPLYKNNPELQSAMEFFMKSAWTPEQVILLKKEDLPARIFVPIQQKFKIGRFEEKIDWTRERKERFRVQISSLHEGDHLTYLALIPHIRSYYPAFYTAGTKPHYETSICLRNEPFAFEPSHGGHIKLVKWKSGRKCFLVDAGSQFKGKGNKTLIATAQAVVDQLKLQYPEFDYIPVDGRGAFGDAQSY
jgi:hypothetical protein